MIKVLNGIRILRIKLKMLFLGGWLSNMRSVAGTIVVVMLIAHCMMFNVVCALR